MNLIDKMILVRQFLRNTTYIQYEGDIYLDDVERYMDEIIETSIEVFDVEPTIKEVALER